MQKGRFAATIGRVQLARHHADDNADPWTRSVASLDREAMLDPDVCVHLASFRAHALRRPRPDRLQDAIRLRVFVVPVEVNQPRLSARIPAGMPIGTDHVSDGCPPSMRP